MRQINNLAFVLLVVVASVSSAKITPSEQCPGENFEDLRNRIRVEPCSKTKCKLPKGTIIKVILKFKPKNVTLHLTNKVSAIIAGVELPFIGVDSTSACEHITHAEDGSPASCPLQAGREYEYVNQFPVEQFYPETNLIVHWSLNDGNKKVICFEVPAAIVKS